MKVSRKTRLFFYIVILLVISGVFYLLIHISSVRSYNSENGNKNFNYSWAMDELWLDGKAEVAMYEAERIVYGQIRKYEYAYILVKETFNEEFNVKTDDYNRKDLFDVMKVNKFARIETQNYPYHYLTSLFFRRQNPVNTYKYTHGAQEWCGNTFKHIKQHKKNYIYFYDSYFDQQGRGSMTIPGDILFEDQLSYTLRTLNFSDGLEFQCSIMESQVTNKADDPIIHEARLSVSSAVDTIVVHEILPPEKLWRIDVELEKDRINTYWIARDYPNLLIKTESWNGRKLLLKDVKREAYWVRE